MVTCPLLIYGKRDDEDELNNYIMYTFMLQIRGLCGHFNYDSADDFLAPMGMVESKPEIFAHLYCDPTNLAQSQCGTPAIPTCPLVSSAYVSEHVRYKAYSFIL